MTLILRDGELWLAPAAFVAAPAAFPPQLGAPADLAATAASCGGIVHRAFTDVIDGGMFVPAPCLCCYAVKASARAEASRALGLFRRHYSPDAYVASRVFLRTMDTLSRDLRPDELAALRRRLSRMGTAPAEQRLHDLVPQLCVAAPPCAPDTLWVYSTGEGRRLLRHLARQLHGSHTLRVVVASSDLAIFPRFRHRMYAAVATPRHCGGPPAATVMLAAAVAWGEAKKARRPRSAAGAPRAPSVASTPSVASAPCAARTHRDRMPDKCP